jgi:hypothetical protein
MDKAFLACHPSRSGRKILIDNRNRFQVSETVSLVLGGGTQGKQQHHGCHRILKQENKVFHGWMVT